MLTFEEIARLVRLHDELRALRRDVDADTISLALELLQDRTRATTPDSPAPESPDDRKRRLARERKREERRLEKASRSERDMPRDSERDAVRDMSRSVTRDRHAQSVTQRDTFGPLFTPETAEPAAMQALSPATLAEAGSVTERDAVRDSERDMSRSGGLGGVVVAESLSGLTATAAVQEQQQALHTHTHPRATRDMSRLVTLDVTRDVTLAVTPGVTPIRSALLPETADKLAQLRETKATQRARLRAAVGLVFAYWRAKLGKDERATLTAERGRLIEQALVINGLDISELCYAIDGLAASRYHQGNNETGTRFDDIQYAVRDRAQVEKFAGSQRPYRAREPHQYVVDAEQELADAFARYAAEENLQGVVNG